MGRRAPARPGRHAARASRRARGRTRSDTGRKRPSIRMYQRRSTSSRTGPYGCTHPDRRRGPSPEGRQGARPRESPRRFASSSAEDFWASQVIPLFTWRSDAGRRGAGSAPRGSGAAAPLRTRTACADLAGSRGGSTTPVPGARSVHAWETDWTGPTNAAVQTRALLVERHRP